jgi:hypothetical protein
MLRGMESGSKNMLSSAVVRSFLGICILVVTVLTTGPLTDTPESSAASSGSRKRWRPSRFRVSSLEPVVEELQPFMAS